LVQLVIAIGHPCKIYNGDNHLLIDLL